MPITNFHRKMLWMLAGLTFCDSVDMAVGGAIGNVLQHTMLEDGVTPWMSTGQFAIFNSVTMIGYLFGGLMAGALADSLGRRKAILACGTIFTVFCFVAAASPDAVFLTGCRFFMGLGLGAAFPAGYSALTEYTPPHKRGKYQSYEGLIANCGTLVASLLNLAILPILGWRPVFIICGCLGTVVMLLIFKEVKESPRWLALMGRNDEADATVTKIEEDARAKGLDVPEVPEEEIHRREDAEEVKQLPWSFLFKKKMLPRTLTAMILCFTMNVIVYTVISWTPTILSEKGFDVNMATALPVVMQLGIPVGVGALTFYVEKVNRKTILIVTYILVAIMGPIWASLPVENTGLIMFFGFILCVCTFTNSVTTAAIYLSEPFPSACRIRGAGIANAFGRFGSILSPIWIAVMLASPLGVMGCFAINAVLCLFTAVWLAVFGVETRGRTLEDITQGLLDEEK